MYMAVFLLHMYTTRTVYIMENVIFYRSAEQSMSYLPLPPSVLSICEMLRLMIQTNTVAVNE